MDGYGDGEQKAISPVKDVTHRKLNEFPPFK